MSPWTMGQALGSPSIQHQDPRESLLHGGAHGSPSIQHQDPCESLDHGTSPWLTQHSASGPQPGLQRSPGVQLIPHVCRGGRAPRPAAVHESDVVDDAGEVLGSGALLSWEDKTSRPSLPAESSPAPRRPRGRRAPSGTCPAAAETSPGLLKASWCEKSWPSEVAFTVSVAPLCRTALGNVQK